MNSTPPYKKNALAATLLVLAATDVLASGILEEVVVTAQKRAQSVNDIGISANAYAGDQLKEFGVDQAVDLGSFTPGLVTVNATSGGTPIFAIRGIGLDDFSANNTSGVGVYTDEVFASSPAYLGGQLFDLERVEVLKGPQGTLYGKNTTGGAINFITNKPTDELEAFVEAGYGRWNTLELTGAVSGPLGDDLRGRVAVNWISADGWQEDVVTDQEYGEQDRFSMRGQLAFDLGDNGDINLRAYYSQDDSKPASPDGEGIGDALFDPSFDALNSPTDPEDVLVGGLDVDREEEGSGIALTVKYAFDSIDFVSITAWDQYERQVLDNYDGGTHSATDLGQDNELDQWSQEFRLVGAGDGSFTWITGVNISHEEVVANDFFDDSFLVTDSVFVGELDPADIPAHGLDRFIADYTQETDSYGLYLHTETQLSDALKLTVGLRYSYDDRSFEGTDTNLSFGEEFIIVELDESNDEDAITGKIGLDWFATEDLLVFGSVSTSYKSGVYYGGAVVDSDAWSYIGPEDILAYELGFKWTLLDGSMQLNGAIFLMEYEDRQSLITFVADDFSNLLGIPVVDTTLAPVPESETSGFELDLNWAPIDGLTVQAGIAFLDSEVSKAPNIADLRDINPDPSVNDQATEVGLGFVDALGAPLEEGIELSQAPEWSYNGMIAYEFGVSGGLLARVQTSYSWLDSQFGQLADSNAEYGSIESINAQVSIGSEDGVWDIRLWGRNLQDNASETYSFTGFAGRTVYKQKPTSYGVTLRYNLP